MLSSLQEILHTASVYNALTFFHVLGVVLGFGGAIMADVMFFKFLKDKKISRFENDVLGTISRVIWVALAILVVTGAGLFLAKTEYLLGNAKFLTKMVAVAVLIVNGTLMNIFVSPHLEKIISSPAGGRAGAVGRASGHRSHGREYFLKKLAFAQGAVSIISWSLAFALGALRRIPLDLGTALLAYGAVLLVGVGVSQVMERRMSK